MASVTVIFGGLEQKTLEHDKPRIDVGREPKCDIHIDNLGISREHCVFEQRGGAFLVLDLNSSNGTYVNGRKVTEHFLNHDDEIIIGKYMLKFKNASQAAQPDGKPDESAPVPDTLNTYVMDGPKIQQQLAKMRADKSGSTGAANVAAHAEAMPPAAKAPMNATARDYGKAMDPNVAPAKSGNHKIILILLALMFLFFLFVLGAVMLYVFYLHPRGIIFIDGQSLVLSDMVQQYFMAR